MFLRRLLCLTAVFCAVAMMGTAAGAQTINIDYNSGSTDFNGSADQVLYGAHSSGHPFDATLSGGNITGVADAYGQTRLTISGGTVGGILYAFDSSVVIVNGGTFNVGATEYSASQMFVNGGIFGKTFGVNFFDNTQLTLNGNLTLVSSTPDGFLGGTDYTYTGTLVNNVTPATYIVNVNNGGRLTVAPEPSAWIYLTTSLFFGSAVMRRRRRR